MLSPLLLDMIMTSIDKGSFSRDINIALIFLLIKKDKDPVDCNSYRLGVVNQSNFLIRFDSILIIEVSIRLQIDFRLLMIIDAIFNY